MAQFEPKTLRVGNKPLPGKFARNPGYQTRMLQPGETFQAAKPIYETVLLATKKVKVARDLADVPAPAPELLEKAAAHAPRVAAPARRKRKDK